MVQPGHAIALEGLEIGGEDPTPGFICDGVEDLGMALNLIEQRDHRGPFRPPVTRWGVEEGVTSPPPVRNEAFMRNARFFGLRDCDKVGIVDFEPGPGLRPSSFPCAISRLR